MKIKGKMICKGWIFLLSTLSVSTLFSYWLIRESVDEKVRGIFIEHDKLVLLDQRKEAQELLVSEIAKEGEGPLDPLWMPLIRAGSNGYIQLGYLVRVLQGNPDREQTYEEIANLIETAPDSFQVEVKPRLLADINAISGIRNEWLDKYSLKTE